MSDSNDKGALPPLEWLRVFEAAGRRGSFTLAGQELGLTQAAISQRIRNLEGHLGARLFVRLRRGVELTTEGEAYLPQVQNALRSLQRSTADLFAAPLKKASIAAPVSVIHLWIIPRLPLLSDHLPRLQLSFHAIQRPGDYPAVDGDFEIRFGAGKWPGRAGLRLYEEVLAPVVAPCLLEKGPSDWRRLPQIAVFGPRYGWQDWAARTLVPPPRPPSLRFDSYAAGLKAAVAGAGAILASLPLSERALAEGHLQRLPEPELRMEEGYWITWRDDRPHSREQETLVSLLTQSGAS